VWVITAVVCFRQWPWQAAAGHLVILAFIGLILAEVCLHGFLKIPFTCSYIPGKSPVHLAILGAILLLNFLTLSVRYERDVLADARLAAAAIAGLGSLWLLARWRTNLSSRSDGEVLFEDTDPETIQVLGL